MKVWNLPVCSPCRFGTTNCVRGTEMCRKGQFERYWPNQSTSRELTDLADYYVVTRSVKVVNKQLEL